MFVTSSVFNSTLVRSIIWIVLGVLATLTLVALAAWGLDWAGGAGQLAPTPRRTGWGEGELADAAWLAGQTPTPSATATPVPPTVTPTPPGPVIHIIEAGDTLLGIALDYGVTVDAILQANGMAASDILSIGQQLLIPINPPPPEPTPTPNPDQPAIGDPSSSVRYICAPEVVVRPLALPHDPIRLALVGGQAYFLAGGDLYGVSLNELAGGGGLAPSNLMPPEREIARLTEDVGEVALPDTRPYLVRELVYMAIDSSQGDLLLLDKSGDIYRRTLAGEWHIEVVAAPIPGMPFDPHYLAVQSAAGSLYALDADLGRIWRFAPGVATPVPYYAGGDVAEGVDLLISGDRPLSGLAFVLTRRGQVLKLNAGQHSAMFDVSSGLGPVTWPAQVLTQAEAVLVVDGEGRRVIGLDPVNGQVIWQMVFRLAGMQRLRSVAQAGDVLYGLAGRNLYVVRMSGLAGACPPVTYDNTLYFDGVDIRAMTAGFRLPFASAGEPLASAMLPEQLRFYPGARRLYRYGVHTGMDFYASVTGAPVAGAPVLAVAAGQVTRADGNYVELHPKEYEAAIARAEVLHRTPPDWVDRLSGRQVHIVHGFGIESRYAHLGALSPGLSAGSAVHAGQVVGSVGDSGTSAAVYGGQNSAHLHLELWINGRYLGHGLSMYETMRLWQAVFE